jgi:RNA recognition motif-containing protein
MKLYVGNINWNTNEEELREHLEQYGEVLDVKIMFDHETGRSRGFGFVTMADGEQAQLVQDKLNGVELHGRPLRINEAWQNQQGSVRGSRQRKEGKGERRSRRDY